MSQQSSTWNLVHHEYHVRLPTRVHAPTRDHPGAWCLPAQIHHAKNHRVRLGPHEMNRVHAQSHPATHHQTEQDQTAMNQAVSQDEMTNPAVSQDQVTSCLLYTSPSPRD